MELPSFVERVEAAVRLRAAEFDAAVFARFAARLSYVSVDARAPESFAGLRAPLEGTSAPIFYLSTSPALYGAICAGLGAAGLATPASRVVVEKPIGRDLASCQAINDELLAVFSEARTFRIDHYLGKEAVQNLLALRFANVLFEPLWSNLTVEHVQITVGETVGVEGRFDYYDAFGAVRDMVQNHMLQLLCLVAMEPPASLDPDSVRNEKVKVLRSLRPVTAEAAPKSTVRGQYAAGVAEGRAAPGYLEEEGARPSDTETFVALKANVDNWRWAGTPFYLRTGKRMPSKASEIVIQFRPVPHSIFAQQNLQANRLVIRLQPEEQVSLSLMVKTPSLERGGMELRPLPLDLSLDEGLSARRRIAYERLLLAAVSGDQTLFVRRDEAEAAWIWIDGIVDAWAPRRHEAHTLPRRQLGPRRRLRAHRTPGPQLDLTEGLTSSVSGGGVARRSRVTEGVPVTVGATPSVRFAATSLARGGGQLQRQFRRHLAQHALQHRRNPRHAFRVGDQVLAGLQLQVVAAFREAVAGGGVVHLVHAVGRVVAGDPFRPTREGRQGGAGGAGGRAVQHAEVPGAVDLAHARREAVHQHQHRLQAPRVPRRQLRADARLVGGVDLRDPGGPRLRGQADIAGDRRAVGDFGHGVGPFGVAVAVDHQARPGLGDQGRVEAPRQLPRELQRADVPGDVPLEGGVRQPKPTKGSRHGAPRVVHDEHERGCGA